MSTMSSLHAQLTDVTNDRELLDACIKAVEYYGYPEDTVHEAVCALYGPDHPIARTISIPWYIWRHRENVEPIYGYSYNPTRCARIESSEFATYTRVGWLKTTPEVEISGDLTTCWRNSRPFDRLM